MSSEKRRPRYYVFRGDAAKSRDVSVDDEREIVIEELSLKALGRGLVREELAALRRKEFWWMARLLGPWLVLGVLQAVFLYLWLFDEGLRDVVRPIAWSKVGLFVFLVAVFLLDWRQTRNVRLDALIDDELALDRDQRS